MQKKKGISLIVLVITIIVMIVLAGAIILSLNNAGIIEKANQAVKDTDEATVKELAQMAWAEAYADGVRNINTIGNVNGFQDRVKTALKDNGVILDDYGINITEKGVEIQKGWLQIGFNVVKGNTILTIGDTINYDETNNGKILVEKDVNWKVLGAENGNLLIVSADSIVLTKYGLGDYNKTGSKELASDGYKNGSNKLDEICENYGYGLATVGKARSIRVEDVNKVTGYNPYERYGGKGNVSEYGSKVSLVWNGTTKPYYTTTTGLKGNLQGSYGGKITYFDGENIVVSSNSGASKENPISITTINNNYYYYNPVTLTTSDVGDVVGIDMYSKAYKMLFRDSNNTGPDDYWLASQYSLSNDTYVYWGMRYVSGGMVNCLNLITSMGNVSGGIYGIRAVVTLSSDITVTGSSQSGWNY